MSLRASPIISRRGKEFTRQLRSWARIRPSYCPTAVIFRAFSTRRPIRKRHSLLDPSIRQGRTHSLLPLRSGREAGGLTGVTGFMRVPAKRLLHLHRSVVTNILRLARRLGPMFLIEEVI